MTISALGTSASALLAQLQQQLLAGYVSANSQNSTDSTGQAEASSFFATGGAGSGGGWNSPGALSPTDVLGSTDASPTGGPVGFGPGMLGALLSYLEQQTSGSATTATQSSATSVAANSTDSTTSNSTDAMAGDSTDAIANPFAQAIFSAISDGGSTISKSQLEAAFTANGGTVSSADALYSQLTASNSGTDGITMSEFETSLPQPGGPGGPGGADGPHHFGHHSGGFGGNQGASATDGSSSTSTTQTVTNADGSTTTTITYADGTTITITEPAPVTASNASVSNSTDQTSGAASSNSTDAANSQWVANFEQYIAQMLQVQSQLFVSASLGNQLSVTA